MIRRIWLIFTLISLLYLGIFFRLFYWQILRAQELKVKALSQYAEKVVLQPSRGIITASDGSPLVLNQSSYLVYAEPHRIEDKVGFSRQIALVLRDIPETKILESISLPERRWVAIQRKISDSKKKELEKLKLKGLGFQASTMRLYPEASMAAHLLGFVGQDLAGNDTGYFGLEGYYNRELSGKAGFLLEERDGKGAPLLIGEGEKVEPENGRTLVLWLDRSIQFIIEKRLLEGLKTYGAMAGTVIVMDPKTGGILGMASFPNYDPFLYASFDEGLYKNPAVASSYEPGSTFKPLIIAAAMNEKRIDAHTTYNETGPVRIGEYTIRTWDDKYRNTMTMTDVLKYSSNVGMVFVSRQLGKSDLLKYIKAYGFGEKTNIDLEEELSPSLRPSATWKEIDCATASFGQGIAVTPLQLIRAMAALANEGRLMQPRVVKEFRDSSGKVVVVKPREIGQVVSKDTAILLKEMMVSSVKYGEAKWAAPKGYRIAGKTGTAQIPVAGHYDKDKTIASFVGYAPADNPVFVMLVILHEPKTSQWGSETAAPLFFQIAKDLFSYLGIPPTNN
jgi:cell division protein FtsI/penicillin-binding protein 2